MEVHLTDDQKAFVRQGIESGRYVREEDALADALSLWESRERARAGILAAVDAAEASLLRDGGQAITKDAVRRLADDAKRRGRARLAAEAATE